MTGPQYDCVDIEDVGPVYCEDCDHMMLPYASAGARNALCTRHKNIGGVGYVSRGLWTNEQPYLRCARMNPKGTCPLWKPKPSKET